MKPSTNALFAALLAAATATMFLAACSQTRSSVVEAPMTLVDGSAGAVASVAPPAVDAGVRAGVELRAGDHFEGHYLCNQGYTTLDLAIDSVNAGKDTKLFVEAVFAFDYAGQTKGSFRLRGTFDPKARALKLEPEEWIEEVDQWSMVGVNGLLARDTLSGKIDGPGCTTFSATRVVKPSAEN